MRVFVAVALSDTLKQRLNEVALGFKPFAVKGNFSHLSNYHITLKYYGEVTHQELETIEDIMDEVAVAQPAFDIRFGEPKTFRKKDKHVLYMSVIDENKHLSKLAKTLNLLSEEVGFDKDGRKYTPHVTLAREVVMSRVQANFNTIKPVTDTHKVLTLTLFQSHRVHGELTYTPLYEVTLKDPH